MSSEEKTAASSPASGGNVHSRRARLLITDDRPEVMAMVEGGLGRRYDCEFTSSLEQAREKLAAEAFQVAICDLQTSKEAGLAQVEEIARDYPETAIVLITDVDDPEVTERTFQLGAHGYIVKPFWPGQLLITVKNALRQRELELALEAEGWATEERSQQLSESLREELTTAEEEAIEDLRASRQETVERLALAIETHDEDTGLHVARMASIAAFLGAKLGFNEDQVLLLRAASPMHDVGKIATPDEILRKPGPLTIEERVVMERHTTFGYQILADSKSELLQMAAAIALTHHERWDGDGYPRGLAGEEIPLEGRVTAVADVFDALLSDRAYRPAMSVEAAIAIVREGRGAHFDPRVVDILLENLDEVLAFRQIVESPSILREGETLRTHAFEDDALDYAVLEPGMLDDLSSSQAVISATVRDAAASRRDRAAEDRDLAAQVRDRASDGEPRPSWSNGASRDRREAAQDRRQAARDRESASHELAYEGIDSLTGVMRRRVGLAAIQREMDRCERVGEPMVLAFVDTVGLKAINDSRGHGAGDRVLQDIAGCIAEDLRSYDLITRIGGDEFVCTFSLQTIAQAEIRYRGISERLARRASGARMTVGLAALRPGDSLETLVDRADQAMLGARR